MKKLFFIAVIASVALAGCIKNDPAPSVNDQNEITFSTPVVALNTKASAVVEGTTYPTEIPFSVWGGYKKDNVTAAYMTDVEVEYSNFDMGDEEEEDGSWRANPAYYWPKQGVLDFDAYSPSSLQGYNSTGIAADKCVVTCDATSGLSFENFVIGTSMSGQIDVMYSTRAADKTSSSYTPGNTYEGVDIQFNHALSVLCFTVSHINGGYPEGTIHLRDINIQALNEGDITQGLDSDGPKWTVNMDRTKEAYTPFHCANYASSTPVTTTVTPVGTPILLLPQTLNKGQLINIVYYIKNGDEEPLMQEIDIDLTALVNQEGTEVNDPDTDTDDEEVTVNEWKMGKRYTYNIIFGLDEIYFAPAVSDWEDVTVALPSI